MTLGDCAGKLEREDLHDSKDGNDKNVIFSPNVPVMMQARSRVIESIISLRKLLCFSGLRKSLEFLWFISGFCMVLYPPLIITTSATTTFLSDRSSSPQHLTGTKKGEFVLKPVYRVVSFNVAVGGIKCDSYSQCFDLMPSGQTNAGPPTSTRAVCQYG